MQECLFEANRAYHAPNTQVLKPNSVINCPQFLYGTWVIGMHRVWER